MGLPNGLKTRQANALRLLLERKSFTASDVAALDYNILSRMPGIGKKSLDIIRAWLISQGLDLCNSPATTLSPKKSERLEIRIVRARNLLEKHGYSVRPPNNAD